MKTVRSVKSTVEKFRWDHKKTLEGDLQDLKILYWHIVAHEILGDFRLDPNGREFDPDYQSIFLAKIVNTYSGIFYLYFDVKYALKKRFNGLHFNEIRKENDLWKDWTEEIKEEMLTSFHEIRRHVTFSFGKSQFMDLDHSFRDIPYNLNAFSDIQNNKTVSITFYLKQHRFFEINTVKVPELPYVYFRHRLKDNLVNKLHGLAEELMKNALLYTLLNEYDNEFQNFAEIEYDGNKEKIRNLPKSISACKRMSIPEAIMDMLRNYPWAKILTPEQLKYHVIAGYRDQTGKKFKNDSVYHAIRRGGYGSHIE